MRRISVGFGPSQAKAGFIALAEAAERYSLQYDDRRPGHLAPFLTFGDAPQAPVPCEELCLGAPQSQHAILSKQSAAGRSLSDATERAGLECLEHFHVGDVGPRNGEFYPIKLGYINALRPHLQFLGRQMRRLDVIVHVSNLGYCVAIALNRDLDMGRPTVGSAAGLTVAKAAVKAVQEAMFQWRNMIEMERSGADVSSLTGREGEVTRIYRGALPHPDWMHAISPITRRPGSVRPRSAGALELFHLVSGRAISAFDMTAPDLGVPVVRIRAS